MLQRIWFATCDAPGCEVEKTAGRYIDGLKDWRRIASTEHLPADGRTAVSTLGRFELQLCPDHAEFFGEHLPTTRGEQGTYDRAKVKVGCACGAPLGIVVSGYHLASTPGPTLRSERLWWEHLPADLQAYAEHRATREQATS